MFAAEELLLHYENLTVHFLGLRQLVLTEGLLLQQVREEALCEILGIVWVFALAPKEGVKRRPVDVAEFL